MRILYMHATIRSYFRFFMTAMKNQMNNKTRVQVCSEGDTGDRNVRCYDISFVWAESWNVY